jgi:hypothetical protein
MNEISTRPNEDTQPQAELLRTRTPGRTTRAVTAMATVVVALLSSLLMAPSANAVSSDGYSGRVGGTGTLYKIAAGHISTYINGVGYVHSPYLSQSPNDVYRSSATSGAQVVTLDWQVYTFTGGAWRYSFSKRVQVSIPAGASGARLPIMSAYPTYGRQYFSVRATYTWWTAQGVKLGHSSVNYNGNDYFCSTKVGYCSIGTGWAWIS